MDLTAKYKAFRVNLLASSLLVAAAFPITVKAAPQGGMVVGGTANISVNGATTQINQSTTRAAINWQSFDVAVNETVNFTVPNGGATLNRVIGGASSTIRGTVRSNGTLYLVNQNGLVFDTTSQVQAQNFVATTSDIDAARFVQGGQVALSSSPLNARIDLKGNITVADHGVVGIIAPQIVNSGTVTANLGQVMMAGAPSLVIDFNGDGLMQFEIGNDDFGRLSESPSVNNQGTITANGGTVTLTALGASGLLNGVVNNYGTISVASVTAEGGTVTIKTDRLNSMGNVNGDVVLLANGDVNTLSGNGAGVDNVAVPISGGINLNSPSLSGSGSLSLGGGNANGGVSLSNTGGGSISLPTPVPNNNGGFVDSPPHAPEDGSTTATNDELPTTDAYYRRDHSVNTNATISDINMAGIDGTISKIAIDSSSSTIITARITKKDTAATNTKLASDRAMAAAVNLPNQTGNMVGSQRNTANFGNNAGMSQALHLSMNVEGDVVPANTLSLNLKNGVVSVNSRLNKGNVAITTADASNLSLSLPTLPVAP